MRPPPYIITGIIGHTGKRSIYTNYEGTSALIRKTEITVKAQSFFDEVGFRKYLKRIEMHKP